MTDEEILEQCSDETFNAKIRELATTDGVAHLLSIANVWESVCEYYHNAACDRVVEDYRAKHSIVLSPSERIRMKTECHRCLFKEDIPGNAHIACLYPDPQMTGDKHGIARGWFLYPYQFDPCWKTKLCSHFSEKP